MRRPSLGQTLVPVKEGLREVLLWALGGLCLGLIPVAYDGYVHWPYGGEAFALALPGWPLTLAAVAAGAFGQRLTSLVRGTNRTRFSEPDIAIFVAMVLFILICSGTYQQYPDDYLILAKKSTNLVAEHASANFNLLVGALLLGSSVVYRSVTAPSAA